MTPENMKKLNENIEKIVNRIKALGERDDGLANDLELLSQDLSLLTAAHNAIVKELKGLQTALLGAGVLTKDGLDLHQSFDVPEKDKVTLPSKAAAGRQSETV